MKLLYTVLLLAGVCVITVCGSVGIAEWAVADISPPSLHSVRSTAVDASGDIYAVGFIYGTSTFNLGNGVTVAGCASGSYAYNAVLVKYNSSGAAQWAKTTVAGVERSEFSSVFVDSNGDIYTSGYVRGTSTYNFGNDVTVAGLCVVNSAVLVRYNSSGVAQWAKTVAGNGCSEFTSVTVDVSGDNYAVGFTEGGSALIAKYNSAGEAQWVKTVSANVFSEFRSVALGASGDIYAVGFARGKYEIIDFGNGVTVSGCTDLGNAVIVNYNSSGVAQWAKTTIACDSYSSYTESTFNSVVVHSSGDIYAAGFIHTSTLFDFDNDVTARGCSSGDNAVLVKYNSAGVTQWAKSVIDDGLSFNSDTLISSISLDKSGSVCAVGHLYGNKLYDFGNNVKVAGFVYNYNNPLIIKYNSSGVVQWAKSTVSGDRKCEFYSIALDTSGNAYVGGGAEDSTIGFGDGVSVTTTYYLDNALLVKYNIGSCM